MTFIFSSARHSKSSAWLGSARQKVGSGASLFSYHASVVVVPKSTPYWIFVTIFTSLLDNVMMLLKKAISFNAIFFLAWVTPTLSKYAEKLQVETRLNSPTKTFLLIRLLSWVQLDMLHNKWSVFYCNTLRTPRLRQIILHILSPLLCIVGTGQNDTTTFWSQENHSCKNFKFFN